MSPTTTGTVTGIFIKPARHEPMNHTESARARAGHGLIGDCHAGPLGPRQVLIVREESLRGLGVEVWQVRANLAIRGLPEEALRSGSILRVGAHTRIRITHECEVCKVLRRYVPERSFPDLPGRRGSLGVILRGGAIALGDPVRATDVQYPTVPDGIYERLAWVVERIPSGSVTTYAELLVLVGASRPFFRVLPTYLKRADLAGLPAHRVLNSAAELTGHVPHQRRRLREEGVVFSSDRRLRDVKHLWDASALYVSRG